MGIQDYETMQSLRATIRRVVVCQLIFVGFAIAAAVNAVQRYGFYKELLGKSVVPVLPGSVNELLHRFIYTLWPLVALIALIALGMAYAKERRDANKPAEWIMWFTVVGTVMAPAVGWMFRARSADSTADEMMHQMAIQLAVITWTVVMSVVAVQAWRKVGSRVQGEITKMKADDARCVPTGGTATQGGA